MLPIIKSFIHEINNGIKEKIPAVVKTALAITDKTYKEYSQ